MMAKSVIVVGAGISGLASAYWLCKAGVDVIVVEQNPSPGGAIRSERSNGFLYEHGPNSLLDTSPLIRTLVDGIGRADRLIEANASAKNRYILRDGRLIPLPMSPPAFIKTDLFSRSAKWRVLREPFIGKADHEETLAEFVIRRLGQEFLDYAVDPFVAGVYAGRADRLSVQAAFKKLYALERDYGSLIRGTIKGAKKRKQSGETSKQSAAMLSFQDGLGELVEGLTQFLGDRIRCASQVTRLEPRTDGVRVEVNGREFLEADQVLITAPAYRTSGLLREIAPDLSEKLDQIEYPPVSVVFFGYETFDRELDGFGYLIPTKEGRRILGTLWSSAIFPDRAPEGGAALTTFVGGARQPEIARESPDALVKLVREELRSIMQIERAPDFIWVKRWERAIPQYNLGHLQILEAIEQFEASQPAVRLSGNYRGGISVSDCIVESHRVAQTLLS